MSESKIIHADCLSLLPTLEENSVDAVVTDPPYGIKFMAKRWDYDVPTVDVWREVLRVLKPGGHLLCACGTRTQHRMVVNIEDAGFEIRDVVSWIYGSGFPKSHNISKAIDKAAGAERKVVGTKTTGAMNSRSGAEVNRSGEWAVGQTVVPITESATPEAQQWDGWGTALKPACEFFTLARKPLSEKTVAENVLKWGTGGINVEGCRVGVVENDDIIKKNPHTKGGFGHKDARIYGKSDGADEYDPSQGRFPANVIHDGSQMVLDLFPESKDGVAVGKNRSKNNHSGNKIYGKRNADTKVVGYGGHGSAARFFYCAKSSKKERGEGNTHPTVKPIALMRYLCRLITPPNGLVMDPYCGSGSTGIAALHEGFNFMGIEIDADYCELANKRINAEDE